MGEGAVSLFCRPSPLCSPCYICACVLSTMVLSPFPHMDSMGEFFGEHDLCFLPPRARVMASCLRPFCGASSMSACVFFICVIVVMYIPLRACVCVACVIARRSYEYAEESRERDCLCAARFSIHADCVWCRIRIKSGTTASEIAGKKSIRNIYTRAYKPWA